MRKLLVISLFGVVGMFVYPAIASEPIKIAAIFAKTGVAATHNAPLIQTVELAVEEINSQGGLLERPVELILLDNKSSPIGSSVAAKNAVQLKVRAVVGAAWSSHSLQMAPILQKPTFQWLPAHQPIPRLPVSEIIFSGLVSSIPSRQRPWLNLLTLN